MTENEMKDLIALAASAIEGDISDEQFSRLQEMLKDSAEARECYYQYITTNALLHDANNIILLSNEQQRSEDFQLLNSLLTEENRAPSVELPKASLEEIVVCPVEVSSPHRQVSPAFTKTVQKFRVGFSIAAVLALAFMIANFVMQPIEVAAIDKMLDVKIAGEVNYQDNTRLAISEDMIRLETGLVEIGYDCGASVVIEGPARFAVSGSKSIKVQSGSVYVKVPTAEAKGFQVLTPESVIEDLGTEFGVRVGFGGVSDIYMTKGKAVVRSSDPASRNQAVLTAGNASRIHKGVITFVEYKETGFVRDFGTGSDVVWRGESINIADLIGGGNGLGDGKVTKSIDPENGKISDWKLADERYGDGTYREVDGSEYIDGVFVPDGGEGPVVISSKGHEWNGPDTSGFFKYNLMSSLPVAVDNKEFLYIDLLNGRSDIMLKAAMDGEVKSCILKPMSWKGNASNYNSLFMHANLGVTIDLDNVRKILPEESVSSFKSEFGIYDIATLEGSSIDNVMVDVWVLVDGEVRLSGMKLRAGQIKDIDIELEASDKFLSLVVTECAEGNGSSYDWGVFVNPRFELNNR